MEKFDMEVEKLSFVDGHPTISHSDESEAAIVRNISARNDKSNIPSFSEKSSASEKNKNKSKKPKGKSYGFER